MFWQGRARFVRVLEQCRHHVARSTAESGAGRFVCNYTLFNTLRRAQLEGGGERACFVHVPEFGMIGEGEQGEFLADFFRTIDALLKAES